MKKKVSAPPFVMLRKDLLKDPEWRKLSSSAKIVYIYLRSKFNRKTLNEVTLAYSEMKDMMAPATMVSAFKQLTKKGFIEKIKQGGLYGGLCTYKFNGKYKHFFYDKQRFRI